MFTKQNDGTWQSSQPDYALTKAGNTVTITADDEFAVESASTNVDGGVDAVVTTTLPATGTGTVALTFTDLDGNVGNGDKITVTIATEEYEFTWDGTDTWAAEADQTTYTLSQSGNTVTVAGSGEFSVTAVETDVDNGVAAAALTTTVDPAKQAEADYANSVTFDLGEESLTEGSYEFTLSITVDGDTTNHVTTVTVGEGDTMNGEALAEALGTASDWDVALPSGVGVSQHETDKLQVTGLADDEVVSVQLVGVAVADQAPEAPAE